MPSERRYPSHEPSKLPVTSVLGLREQQGGVGGGVRGGEGAAPGR